MARGLAMTGALVLTSAMRAQSVDVGATFSVERAQIATAGAPSLWLKGGSADVAFRLRQGLGIAATITGEHLSNLTPGVNLGTIAYMGGPRFTTRLAHTPKQHTPRIFVEALFGVVHGFDSAFPAGTSAVTSTAHSFAMQAGGALSLPLGKGIGLRLVEAKYVRTTLPNNASNVQNSLRLAAGLTCSFGRW